jgi:phospholipase C
MIVQEKRVRRQKSWSIIVAVLASSLLGVINISFGAGASRAASPRAADISLIQHIIFIIKENRTFDNYFGTFPEADGATHGTISTGQVIPLGHLPDSTGRDISHSFTADPHELSCGKHGAYHRHCHGAIQG